MQKIINGRKKGKPGKQAEKCRRVENAAHVHSPGNWTDPRPPDTGGTHGPPPPNASGAPQYQDVMRFVSDAGQKLRDVEVAESGVRQD